MRNLKRALSLLLSSAMVVGMMVMGGSAAGYQDVDASNKNQEAIEVLQAVGVMSGIDNEGNFDPDGSVTRNQMAVIMAHLLNLDYDYYRGTNPFTDVPEWAAPYVAACAAEGVIAGIGDNQFGGEMKVTAAQASLMIMKALGYFQNAEDFGDDWQIATIRQASYINLFDRVNSDATSALTRGQVAQLVLNGLKAKMVDFTGDKGVQIGDVTVGYRAEYTPKAGAAEKYNTIDDGTTNINADDQYYIQLGEELYNGDLSLKGSTDDFARPANNWRYDGKDIGTYTHDADLTYTSDVNANDIYTDLGLSKTIAKDKVTVYVNGVVDEDLSVSIRKGSKDNVGDSANGVLTQVYYNKDKETILVTHIDTYVGTIAKTVEATDSQNAYVVVVPETPIHGTAPISSGKNFETDEKFDDDAYVLYTYSESAEEIKSVELAQELNGVVTRAENANTNEQDAKALTIDGTRYVDSANVAGEELGDISVNEQYTVYLDSYGYLIYVERIDEIGDYALLYTTDTNAGVFNSNKAYLIFADGTSAVVNTAKNYDDEAALSVDQNGNGTMTSGEAINGPIIVTYRVDEDGVYTLRGVSREQSATVTNVTVSAENDTDFTLINDKAGIVNVGTGTGGNTVTANSATTFVVRDPSGDRKSAYNTIDTSVDWTAYTGIKNAPTIKVQDLDGNSTVDQGEQVNVYYYCKSGSMATIMFIVPDKDVVVEDGVNKTLFLSQDSVSNLIHDASGDYYEYQAVANGEIVTVKVDANVILDGVAQNNQQSGNVGDRIYDRYNIDKNGIITRLTSFTGSNYVTGDESGYADYTGIDKVSKEYTVILNPDKLNGAPVVTITVAEDANIFYVDEDGNVSISSYNAIAIDDDDKVYAVVDDYMVQTLVIVEVNTKNNAQPATVTISGEKDVLVGEELVLTAKVTLKDPKNDEIRSYQWYMDGTADADKIAGATSDTLKVDTSVAGTHTYYCVVETYNGKVPGNDTATATGTSKTITIKTSPSDYEGELTVDVAYSGSGINGLSKDKAWNVTDLKYDAGMPTHRQIVAKIIETVVAEQDVTYVGPEGTGPYYFKFTDGYQTFWVKYAPSTVNTEETISGDVSASDLNQALTASKNVTLEGDVTVTGNLTIPSGGNLSVPADGSLVIEGTLSGSGHVWAAGNLTVNNQAIVGGSDAIFTVGTGAEVQVVGNNYIMRMTDKAENDDTARGTITMNKAMPDNMVLQVKNGVELKLANGVNLTLSGLLIRENAKISNVASVNCSDSYFSSYLDEGILGGSTYLDHDCTITLAANS